MRVVGVDAVDTGIFFRRQYAVADALASLGAVFRVRIHIIVGDDVFRNCAQVDIKNSVAVEVGIDISGVKPYFKVLRFGLVGIA